VHLGARVVLKTRVITAFYVIVLYMATVDDAVPIFGLWERLALLVPFFLRK